MPFADITGRITGFRKDFERADPLWFEKVHEAELENVPLPAIERSELREFILYRVPDAAE